MKRKLTHIRIDGHSVLVADYPKKIEGAICIDTLTFPKKIFKDESHFPISIGQRQVVFADKELGLDLPEIPKEESKDFLGRTEFDLLKQQAIEEEMEEFDKQETLEEAAEKLSKDAYKKHSVKDDSLSLDQQIQRSGGFIVGFKEGMKEGAKWQSERIPSIIEEYLETAFISKEQGYMNPQKWFEQFKKK